MLVSVPVAREPTGSAADAYRFFHFSLPKHVEQAFKQLVACWHLFGPRMGFGLRDTVRFIECVMALHNFCKT